MNRRRTAAAVLTVCAVGALTACSSTAHPGAAAVVGDQRISVSALESHVTAYRNAAAAEGQAGQEPAGVPAKTLSLLVSDQIVQQALSARGAGVTDTQVQQAEASDLQQVGSVQALQRAAVSQLAIAPADLGIYYRFKLGEVKLLRLAGVNGTTDQATAQTRFQQLIEQASKDIGVTVNPRYGSWDAGTLSLAAAQQPWLKVATTAQS